MERNFNLTNLNAINYIMCLFSILIQLFINCQLVWLIVCKSHFCKKSYFIYMLLDFYAFYIKLHQFCIKITILTLYNFCFVRFWVGTQDWQHEEPTLKLNICIYSVTAIDYFLYIMNLTVQNNITLTTSRERFMCWFDLVYLQWSWVTFCMYLISVLNLHEFCFIGNDTFN